MARFSCRNFLFRLFFLCLFIYTFTSVSQLLSVSSFCLIVSHSTNWHLVSWLLNRHPEHLHIL